MNRGSNGFTLVELLIVIAIIGILAAIILVSLGSAREKGGDATVQGTLAGMRPQAELWSIDHKNIYGPVSIVTATTANDCGALDSGNTVFSDQTILNMMQEVTTNGGGTISCAAKSDAWGFAANLRTSTTTYFCVDSSGQATTTINQAPVSDTTALCQ